jgi:hypothetical protein
MTIQFHCKHCRKEIQAPDAAGGKRGKCPFCGTSNYIPAPVTEEDAIPLAPIDDEDERRRQKEVEELLRQERDLLVEIGNKPVEPQEPRTDEAKTELRNLVVKHCLFMYAGKLPQAQAQTDLLTKQAAHALKTVEDFMSGREIDPALATMPGGLLQGFLRQLKQHLQEKAGS